LEKDRLHETIKEVFDRSEETNGTSLAADFIIGMSLARVFSDLPAIFPGDVAQDSLQVEQRVLARFGTREAGRNTLVQGT
jgi:hypothetical protein